MAPFCLGLIVAARPHVVTCCSEPLMWTAPLGGCFLTWMFTVKYMETCNINNVVLKCVRVTKGPAWTEEEEEELRRLYEEHRHSEGFHLVLLQS